MIVSVYAAIPSLRSYAGPFLLLSYRHETSPLGAAKGLPSTYYTQGRDDIFFIAGAVVLFTAVRAMVMEWILVPFARSRGLSKKAAVRFAEQGWLIIYDGTFWALGMVGSKRSRFAGSDIILIV